MYIVVSESLLHRSTGLAVDLLHGNRRPRSLINHHSKHRNCQYASPENIDLLRLKINYS